MKYSKSSFASRAVATIASCAALSLSFTAGAANIVVGGTFSSTLQTALDNLGYSYTVTSTMTPDPTTYGLGAGDIIVIGNDGGTDPFYNYNAFLNAGGHIIATGGSNYQPYRDWADDYFNITDTGSGWHTDGAWHTTASVTASQYIPSDVTFDDNSFTYHMLGFSATPDTVLYGKNDENVSIAAIRSYANGGTFDYMALDIGGGYGSSTDHEFTEQWLKGALMDYGAPVNRVPDAGSSFSLMALAFAPIFAFARRQLRR